MKLPVTLCAVDHAAHDLTRMALQRCLDQFDFADVLICSDREILPGARHVRTYAKIADEAELILNSLLPKHINTSHYLYIQWDSWIINPYAWDDAFLHYDWIGAPWPRRWIWKDCNPAHDVGNGGFSLRSMKLANAVLQLPLDEMYSPEDHAICVKHRPTLEQAGCRWSAANLAQRFSVEADWPDCDPFGFHGAFRFANVLTPDEYDHYEEIAPAYVKEHQAWQCLRGNVAKLRQGARLQRCDGPLKGSWT